VARGRPDQQRALGYGAGSLRDLDLHNYRASKGVISSVGQFNQTLTVRFGSQSVLLNVSKQTRILLPNGHRGTFANLESGDTISVVGARNQRLDEVTATREIRITNLPRQKPG
jgi:hypothetical protein